MDLSQHLFGSINNSILKLIIYNKRIFFSDPNGLTLDEKISSLSAVGDPEFMAPEIRREFETAHYSYSADIYSLGVTFRQILLSNHSDANKLGIIWAENLLWSSVIKPMIQIQPDDRQSIDEVMANRLQT